MGIRRVSGVEDGMGGCARGDGRDGSRGFGGDFGTRGWEAFDDYDADGFLLGEVAVDVNDADGEKAGLVREGFACAGVDVYGSVGSEAVQDPKVAVADGVRDGEEACVEGWVVGIL